MADTSNEQQATEQVCHTPVIVLLLQGAAKVNQVLIQDVADHAARLIYDHLCLALHSFCKLCQLLCGHTNPVFVLKTLHTQSDKDS